MAAAAKELPACPVETTLTDLGYSLKPILDAMRNWGEAYKAQKQG